MGESERLPSAPDKYLKLPSVCLNHFLCEHAATPFMCLFMVYLVLPTSFYRHVGRTPLSRHRFAAMSGEHLCPDIVLLLRRGNASAPTSFCRHVGRTPLPRHRFIILVYSNKNRGSPRFLTYLLLSALKVSSDPRTVRQSCEVENREHYDPCDKECDRIRQHQ